MKHSAFSLFSRRVVLRDGVRPATVVVDEGRIAQIHRGDVPANGVGEVTDLGDLVVMPGVIDAHVHINEPGRTEWEGFATATRAAAAGGVTMLVDMPLNSSPVTTTPEALGAKIEAAQRSALVDVGFWGGLVPANAGSLSPLLDAGVLGVKCFLVHSGIDEFPGVGREHLIGPMWELAKRGLPLLVHAEDPAVIQAYAPVSGRAERSYAAYLRSRPDEAEVSAIRMMVELCEETGCRVHIVHLATEQALPLLAAARLRGLPLTVETCPHYLTFAAEEIPDGAAGFKCAPPIRGGATREALWGALRTGVIDLIGSDHSPCPPGMKKRETGDFFGAWGGIASLQFLLPAVWTGARERGAMVEDVSRWLCAAPARLAGLNGRKGALVPGYDADITVWDPEAIFTVERGMIQHRHTLTPYEGKTLHGRVVRTIVRGETAHAEGRFGERMIGHVILRNQKTKA